jgi:putative transposase
MQTEMTAQLVTDALVMAIWRRGKPDALLHHSDRGSQYTSEQFQRLMADHGVVCSISRSGNVLDNAAMESFFSSLKTERTARKIYRTRNEAKADVFDYIERFYMGRSIKRSGIGSKTCLHAHTIDDRRLKAPRAALVSPQQNRERLRSWSESGPHYALSRRVCFRRRTIAQLTRHAAKISPVRVPVELFLIRGVSSSLCIFAGIRAVALSRSTSIGPAFKGFAATATRNRLPNVGKSGVLRFSRPMASAANTTAINSSSPPTAPEPQNMPYFSPTQR